MRIFCSYNRELDIFLKAVVDYVFENFAYDLDLSNLNEIELCDKQRFDDETDGQTCEGGKKVVVTSRLYEKLPSTNVKLIENNTEFKMLVNTLYHEMGHVNDWKQMPNLYGACTKSDDEEIIEESVSAFFLLEYVSEKRSCVTGLVDYSKDCERFCDLEWNLTECNRQNKYNNNFFYLQKKLPYFIARTINIKENEKYILKMRDKTLLSFVKELATEIEQMEKELPFDDVDKVRTLYDILNKYFGIFFPLYKDIGYGKEWF